MEWKFTFLLTTSFDESYVFNAFYSGDFSEFFPSLNPPLLPLGKTKQWRWLIRRPRTSGNGPDTSP
jgi:hypothetical protein